MPDRTKRSPDRSPERTRRRRDEDDSPRGSKGRSPSRRHRSRSKSASPPRERKKRSANWDQPPEGADLAAMAAVSTNPLAAFQMSSALPVNAAQNMMNAQLLLKQLAATQGLGSQVEQQKKKRELYVGNLPVGIGLTGQHVIEFFNQAMMAAGLNTSGQEPVINCWMSADGKYCFVEFRTKEEASYALCLDGVSFHGRTLRVGRPKNYIPDESDNLIAPPTTRALGTAGTGANNVPLGASVTATQVLVLMNMVTAEELVDPSEYDDILQDVREECSKFGQLLEINIPRPSTDDSDVPGLGKVFLKYSSDVEAQKAFSQLSGRRFSNRTVVTSYLEPEKFDARDFS